MATIEEAITALGNLMEEADNLLPIFRTPLFKEKLLLWTKRSVVNLNKWGLSQEAGRLNSARGDMDARDMATYDYSTLKARMAILEALRDDFTNHPEFYTEMA